MIDNSIIVITLHQHIFFLVIDDAAGTACALRRHQH